LPRTAPLAHPACAEGTPAMNHTAFLALLTLTVAAAFSGCTTSVNLPQEIYVHSEKRPASAFLRWVPANVRSFAGSYYGEMGDTAENAYLTVNDREKPVTVEGKFVTRTVEGSPREQTIDPVKIEMDSPPWFTVSGRKAIFVTYMDPERSVFRRPVNGLIYNGLFYVKESELE
jgi:hypothetical protein